MKPLYVLALVLAAIAGGVVVKMTQKSSEPTPAQVAQVQPETASPQSAPAAVEPAREPEKPSALPPRAEVAKTQVVRRTRPSGDPEPVARPAAEPPPAEPPQTASVAPAPAPSAPEAPREPQQLAPPAPEPPRTVTIGAGTLIQVRLIDGVTSERNKEGDTFQATLDRPLVVDGYTVAERGARAEGRVVAADPGGKVRGVASLSVALTRIHTADGQTIAVDTDGFQKQAEQSKSEDAKKVGVGAAVGALIGAIAGGGKGAAIGAGVGGGAGAGGVLLTRGEPASLPSETRISFRLRAPVTVTEKR